MKVEKSITADVWSPPLAITLKFNVDGFARGLPGMAGISGVLRDCNCKVLCVFSLCIGIQDSNLAEIKAIHKAYELYVSNVALIGRDVEIVNNSMMVVSWVSNKDFGCLKHIDIIYDIRSMCGSRRNI